MLPDALAHHHNIQWRCLRPDSNSVVQLRVEPGLKVLQQTFLQDVLYCSLFHTVNGYRKTYLIAVKKSHRTSSKFLAHSKLVLQWKVKRLTYIYSYSKSQLFSSSFIKMVSGFGREEWGLGCRWVTEKKTEDWNSRFLPLLFSNN